MIYSLGDWEWKTNNMKRDAWDIDRVEVHDEVKIGEEVDTTVVPVGNHRKPPPTHKKLSWGIDIDNVMAVDDTKEWHVDPHSWRNKFTEYNFLSLERILIGYYRRTCHLSF